MVISYGRTVQARRLGGGGGSGGSDEPPARRRRSAGCAEWAWYSIAWPWDAESRKSERGNEQLEPAMIPAAEKEGQ